uniref:Uncharacterized protein n=1 Tax=Romanomermis culicivorax TaxID=13658 RepID=A0A915J1H5_ROMCU
MAMRCTLNFDQIMPLPTTNITQSSVLPAISLPPPNLPLSIFSNSALDGTAPAQVPLIFATSTPTNLHAPSPLDSSDSFINIDPLQASAATQASLTDHRSSLAIANANEVCNFQIEAWDTLEQLSTPAARITNNIPTVQSIKLLAPFPTNFKLNNYASNGRFKNKFNLQMRGMPPWLNRCNN